ncbi:ABC transporter ATP-binding protein [Lactiplantibacillus plantarum]|uniref:ABC transporter ATP-binding protein n=1 Tax=Lactiplantibacillus plantarum TaxID=1590 RepID=UPI0037BFED6E
MTANDNDPLIEISDVSTVYGARKNILGKGSSGLKAVNNVSFDIYQGETVGLVGESGSGKSTLGRTILGLEHQAHGDVKFRGQSLSDLRHRDKSIVANMQMIFQDPFGSLDPRQSIGAAIEEVMRIHHMYSKKERQNKVKELLLDVGLNEGDYDRYPHEFSGGQRQRIGIARAIALDPSIVICDEAVSALDVSIQAQVLDLLKSLQKKRNFTYLFITHDLGVVRDISDRILVMYLGTIVESGTTEQIFRNPIHPYTQRLLRTIPRPDPNKRMTLSSKIVTMPKPASTEMHEVEDGHMVVAF